VVITGVLISVPSFAQQQDSISLRVLSYNMDSLGFPRTWFQGDFLDRIPQNVQPNILISQGIYDSIGASQLWAIFPQNINARMSPYFGKGHSVLMYDSTLVTLLSYNSVPTKSLPIDEYIMYVPSTSDTFIIASCHFVAGEDSVSVADRAAQAQTLRYHLHQRRTQNVLVAGTLNFYSSSENGFRWLTEDMPFGDTLFRNPMRDPIDSIGEWHNNPNFARWHTFATRIDSNLGTRGLVDRFDYILLSQQLISENYVHVSHKVTGNYGIVFGKSITNNGRLDNYFNRGLESGSIHLPVQIDLMFRRKSTDVKRDQTSPKEMDLSSVDRHSVNETLIAQPSGSSTPNILPLTGQQSLAAP
jgi:hypothetical protein